MLLKEDRPVPALIARDNLELENSHLVAPEQLMEMPPFRVTDLTDAQIQEVTTTSKRPNHPKAACDVYDLADGFRYQRVEDVKRFLIEAEDTDVGIKAGGSCSMSVICRRA